ncbi:MAG: FkbM family methyltransferase [Candidatus Omnitrophica bacterium]|nr:FkbM family methyltransferase [Candidatus Omnitrophota bacterium]
MAGGILKRWLGIKRVRPYSTYLDKQFKRHIERAEVKLVFEVGSRDLKDAILLQKFFRARVFAFECNPDSLSLCRQNLAKAENVVLIEKAVWNQDKKIQFFPVVASYDDDLPELQAKNIGSSSCFMSANLHYEKLKQCEIEVDAIRLDGFCHEYGIQSIDLLCMDLQGAEFEALQGLGDVLNRVRYIISEIETIPLYQGQKCLDDVSRYLSGFGFKLAEEVPCIGRNGKKDSFANYLFINQAFK